eukprot:scaffold79981_cov51-Phaeocystis_antarctica.AAC.1
MLCSAKGGPLRIQDVGSSPLLGTREGRVGRGFREGANRVRRLRNLAVPARGVGCGSWRVWSIRLLAGAVGAAQGLGSNVRTKILC